MGNRIKANPNRKPEPFGFNFCVAHAKKSRLLPNYGFGKSLLYFYF